MPRDHSIRKRLGVATCVAALLLVTAACGDDGGSGSGGSDDAIKIGGTYPLSGPLAAAGQRGQGVKAYFDYLNDNGGIDGRDVEYVLRDDAYNPSTTLQMTRQLVEQDQVLATVGSLGTSTQLAVREFLNGKKIPQLFVSSAFPDFTQDYEEYPYTMGWEVPALTSGQLYAKDIIANDPEATVAVLFQDDEVGNGYLSGFEDEIATQDGVEVVATQGYDPTATSVTSQISALKESGATTLVIFAVPGFTPKALSAAYSQNWSPTTYVDPGSLSAAEMNSVADQAGTSAAVDGVRSATFFKDPNEPSLEGDEGIALYKEIIEGYCDGCDASSIYYLQGMSQGWAFSELLKGIDGDITSEAIMEAATAMDQTGNPFLLNGMVVTTSEDDHQPLDQLQIVKFQDKTFSLVGDLITS